MAAESMEVVMEAKGAAVTVAANEAAAMEEVAVAERDGVGNLRREEVCKSATEMHVVADEPCASCSKRSCRATCCAEEHYGVSVSMVSGRKMLLISARASGRDGDAGVGEADRVSVDEGLVAKTMMRVAAGASWASWPRWEEEGGGSIATTTSFL